MGPAWLESAAAAAFPPGKKSGQCQNDEKDTVKDKEKEKA